MQSSTRVNNILIQSRLTNLIMCTDIIRMGKNKVPDGSILLIPKTREKWQPCNTNKSTIHFHVLQGMHILQALQSLMNAVIPLSFFIRKSNHSLIGKDKRVHQYSLTEACRGTKSSHTQFW